jgi:hypothetical protein
VSQFDRGKTACRHSQGTMLSGKLVRVGDFAEMNSVPLWVTLLGFAVPLMTLAGSAVAYVVKLYLESAERRRNRFFELMQIIDSDSRIAKKVAAVYELRRFPEHRDFILRFCTNQKTNITGVGAHILVAEMEATQAFFEK